MNYLQEMASASELVLPGRCCIVVVKWCCAANINRVCVRFMVRVAEALALPHKGNQPDCHWCPHVKAARSVGRNSDGS